MAVNMKPSHASAIGAKALLIFSSIPSAAKVLFDKKIRKKRDKKILFRLIVMYIIIG
jgi:hypothetical protein